MRTESVPAEEDGDGEHAEELQCMGGGSRPCLWLGGGKWDAGTGNQRGHFHPYLTPLFTLWNFSFCDYDSLL